MINSELFGTHAMLPFRNIAPAEHHHYHRTVSSRLHSVTILIAW
jgi:hypothetical protein